MRNTTGCRSRGVCRVVSALYRDTPPPPSFYLPLYSTSPCCTLTNVHPHAYEVLSLAECACYPPCCSPTQWYRYDIIAAPLLGIRSSDLKAISAGHKSLHSAALLYQVRNNDEGSLLPVLLDPCHQNSTTRVLSHCLCHRPMPKQPLECEPALCWPAVPSECVPGPGTVYCSAWVARVACEHVRDMKEHGLPNFLPYWVGN